VNVILYRRVSTQEQGTSRNGLEAQATALERFVEANGLQTVGSFEEVASAKHGLDRRPELAKAVEMARKARAVLLVSKLDRLSREVEFIAAMMNSRTRFATVEDGLECDPFMLHLKASFAEKERTMIGERTKAALSALKARGAALGAHAHADPQALARGRMAAAETGRRNADAFASFIIPTIRRMVTANMPYVKIADELNALGTRTARGGVWHASTVCNVLKRASRMGT